ncbi:MAG: primosomal protein N', partial [Anaerolineae bacterium]|nr:primosomal protein N' [Anaerolineae bacterium]
MYAQVIFNLPLDQPFTYAVPEALAGRITTGHLVQVPFRTATEYAVVVELTSQPPPYATKPILMLVDQLPVVTPREIELALWLSKSLAAPPG